MSPARTRSSSLSAEAAPSTPDDSTATPLRSGRSAERTQARILEAATRLFVDKGFDGARVDELAALAQVNKRMLYAYFGNKEGLYAAVLRSNFERVLKSAGEASLPAGSAVERTRAILRWYLRFLAGNSDFVRLLGWESLNLGRVESAAIAEVASAGLSRLETILSDGVRDGSLRGDDELRYLVVAVSGMCLAFFNRRALLEALWGVDLSQAETLDAIASSLERLLLDGLRTRGSSPPRPS